MAAPGWCFQHSQQTFLYGYSSDYPDSLLSGFFLVPFLRGNKEIYDEHVSYSSFLYHPPFLLALPGLTSYTIHKCYQSPNLPTFSFFLILMPVTKPLVFLKYSGASEDQSVLTETNSSFISVLRNCLQLGTAQKPSVYILHEPCGTSLSARCYLDHPFLIKLLF